MAVEYTYCFKQRIWNRRIFGIQFRNGDVDGVAFDVIWHNSWIDWYYYVGDVDSTN